MIFGSRATLRAESGSEICCLEDGRTASGAAEAAARVTQEPQFLYVRGEREVLAAASVLPTAWGDRTPLIVVTQVPGDAEKRVRAVLKEVTRRQICEETPDESLACLARLAWGQLPVHVSLPFDCPVEYVVSALAKRGVLFDDRRPLEPRGVGAAPWIAAKLARARRPVILLGREGLRQCELEVVLALASAVDAPILLTTGATALAVGLPNQWSVLSQRASVVTNPSPVWDLTMYRSDLVLALGAQLAEADLFGLHDIRWFRGQCIAVSSFEKLGVPEERARRVQCPPEAIVKPILDAMRIHRPRKPRRRWRARAERRTKALRRIAIDEASRAAARTEIDPAWAAWRISASAPSDTRFMAEGNITGLWLRAFAEVDRVVTPIHMGTIGLAIPWMVGIHAARAGAPVWAAVGDGAFLFQPAALRDLRRIGPAGAVFVFNDGSWNSIRMAQTFIFSGRYVGTDLLPLDYAELARSLGCDGYVATTPAELDEALERVREPGRTCPAVVDVRVRPGSIPWLGFDFALAEVDYVLRPMLRRIVVSSARAILRGRVQWRSLRVVLRVAFS